MSSCSLMFRVGYSGGLGDFRLPAVTFCLVLLMALCWSLLSVRMKQRSDSICRVGQASCWPRGLASVLVQSVGCYPVL